jgi:hypothetical protein
MSCTFVSPAGHFMGGPKSLLTSFVSDFLKNTIWYDTLIPYMLLYDDSVLISSVSDSVDLRLWIFLAKNIKKQEGKKLVFVLSLSVFDWVSTGIK